MAILAVANRTIDFDSVAGSGVVDSTLAGSFDPVFTQSSVFVGGSGAVQRNFTPSGPITWFSYRWHRSSTSGQAGTGQGLDIRDAAGNLLMSNQGVSSTSNSFFYTLYGATNDTSVNIATSGVFTLKIDIRLDMTGPGATAEIYHNGVLVDTLAVADKGTRGNPVSLWLRPSAQVYWGWNYHYVSEVMIADTSLLGRRLISLNPGAVGAHSDFIGGLSTLTDDDPITGLVGDADGERHSWTLSSYAGPAGTLEAVCMNFIAHRTSGVPSQVGPFLRVGGNNYDGPLFTVRDATRRSHLWHVNPATLAPWLSGDLASLQAGLRAAT